MDNINIPNLDGPVPEKPKSKKNCKPYIIITAALIAVIVIAALLITLLPKTTLDAAAYNTLKEVFPVSEEFEQFSEIFKDSYHTKTSIGFGEGFIIEGFEINGFPEIVIDSNKDGKNTENNISVLLDGKSMIDLSTYYSNEAFIIKSDKLLNNAYGINIKTLREDLDKSVIAPDSGSTYALDQESFDNICKIADMLNGEQTESIENTLRTIFDIKLGDEQIKELKEHYRISESKGKIELDGESINVNTTEITIDKEAVQKILSFYADTIRNIEDTYFASLADIFDDFKKSFDTLEAFDFTAKLHVNGKYLVLVENNIVFTENGEATEININCNFGKNPAKTKHMDLVADIVSNGENVAKLAINVTNTDNLSTYSFIAYEDTEAVFDCTLTIGNNEFALTSKSDGENVLKINGSYELGKDKLSFGLNEISIDGAKQKLTFNYTANTEAKEITVPEYLNITTFSENDFSNLIEELSYSLASVLMGLLY